MDGQRFTKNHGGYYCSSDGRNRLLHHYVWEKHNGPIPRGMVIHHINEDKTDNLITNLAMMSRGAHSAHHNTGKTRKRKISPTCASLECNRQARARGLCTMHYQRAKKEGFHRGSAA